MAPYFSKAAAEQSVNSSKAGIQDKHSKPAFDQSRSQGSAAPQAGPGTPPPPPPIGTIYTRTYLAKYEEAGVVHIDLDGCYRSDKYPDLKAVPLDNGQYKVMPVDTIVPDKKL